MLSSLIKTRNERQPHGVRWLVLSRLVIIILCIAVLLVRGLAQAKPSYGPSTLYMLLTALAVLDVGYYFLLPLVSHGLHTFLLMQFLVDIGAETGLVFLTGGVDSNFVNLYFVSIMAATMLLSRGMSSLFAFLASSGLAIVTALYLTRVGMEFVAPGYAAQPGAEILVGPVLQKMLLIVGAFFVVGYLSGLLAERLETARSLNEEILQNMAEGVAVFDSGGGIIFVNAEFERLFSRGRPVQLGERAAALFPDAADAELRRVLAERMQARFEMPAREDRARPPVEVRTSMMGDPGSPRGVVLLAIDLSQVRRAELAERRAERFSAVSQMAAGLAHELRNPLASVRGSIQEISRDFVPGSPNRRLAEIVLKESDRLDNIITNFLQFARQRPLHPRAGSLPKMLAEVQLLLRTRPDCGAVNVELLCGEAPEVRCDVDQVREVFLNLGVNALAAMVGEGKLTIRCPHRGAPPPGTEFLRKRADETGVTVSFSDTGPGMPPGAEELIFEPFYTTKAKGTGLGLAVARRVVESHEGRIWVRSRPGEGATFYVWLPLSGPFTPGAPLLDGD